MTGHEHHQGQPQRQQDLVLNGLDIAQQGFNRFAEGITQRRKGNRPDRRGKGVQDQKLPGFDIGQAQSDRVRMP